LGDNIKKVREYLLKKYSSPIFALWISINKTTNNHLFLNVQGYNISSGNGCVCVYFQTIWRLFGQAKMENNDLITTWTFYNFM